MMNKSESLPKEVLAPEIRLKELTKLSNTFNVNFNTPPIRYFRSGNEMIRMAKVYLDERNFEQAFVLFLKFMTLFIEKIREHPDFKTVPINILTNNRDTLKEIIPLAEKLKNKILKIFTEEYDKYLCEKKKREVELKQKNEEELALKRKQLENNNSKDIKSRKLLYTQDNVVESTIKPVPHLPDDSFMYNIPNLDPVLNSSYVNKNGKPGVDRSTKPVCTNNFAVNSNVGSSSLRVVVVPSKLMEKFLVLAQKNTDNNIETCGILAGKLSQNRLVITHLLIPKQYGTANSCTTDNEEEIFAYQDEHNLITLGWIHTHPSQTAFLSSVDLHTHCSYQLMMAEAIAIVCSPRYSQIGFYSLTPDYGLDFIANCKEKGFHPHPNDPLLFMDSEHCELNVNGEVEVSDLRR